MKRKEVSAVASGAPAVKVVGLRKKYPRAAEYAVGGISFEVQRGEIVGLLGHNGAGKSTTLKCLTGMLPYKEGEISVFGVPVKGDATEAKAHFGFVTDDHAVFSKMTGMEYIAFMADIYGVPKEVREERLGELQKCFGLGDRIESLISSYSHGMKVSSTLPSSGSWTSPCSGLTPPR